MARTINTPNTETDPAPKPGETFRVVAHDHAKDEEVETVVGLLGKLSEASRLEPANLEFTVYQSPEDPARLVILERYEDEAGFAAHRDSEHFQRLAVGEIIPRLRSRTVETYRALTLR